MKKILTAILILFVFAGCSAKLSQPSYYRLPAAEGDYETTGTPFIRVASVKTADYLRTKGIVYQTDKTEYTTARENLWLEPLSVQLQKALADELRQNFPAKYISTEIQAPYQVSVTVNAFHGRYDGTAVVSGEWLIKHESGHSASGTFSYLTDQKKDGYTPLINALDTGWKKAARLISDEIIKIEQLNSLF